MRKCVNYPPFLISRRGKSTSWENQDPSSKIWTSQAAKNTATASQHTWNPSGRCSTQNRLWETQHTTSARGVHFFSCRISSPLAVGSQRYRVHPFQTRIWSATSSPEAESQRLGNQQLSGTDHMLGAPPCFRRAVNAGSGAQYCPSPPAMLATCNNWQCQDGG